MPMVFDALTENFAALIEKSTKIINPKLKYVLKRVSFGSKYFTKELKLECAYFLGQTC